MMGWIHMPRNESAEITAPGSGADYLPGWVGTGNREFMTVRGTPLSDSPRTPLSRVAIAFEGVVLAVLIAGLVLRSQPMALGSLAVLAIVNWRLFWAWVFAPPPMSYVVRSGGMPPRAVIDRAEDLMAYERELGHAVWLEATTAAGVFYRVRDTSGSSWVPYWVRSRADGSVVIMRLAVKSLSGDSATWISIR